MYQVQVPIKKYQNLASIAAVVGFLLGLLIPLSLFAMGRWACPFGERIIHVTVFVLLTGIVGAVLLGNLAAVVLILIAKYRSLSSQPTRSRKK